MLEEILDTRDIVRVIRTRFDRWDRGEDLIGDHLRTPPGRNRCPGKVARGLVGVIQRGVGDLVEKLLAPTSPRRGRARASVRRGSPSPAAPRTSPAPSRRCPRTWPPRAVTSWRSIST